MIRDAHSGLPRGRHAFTTLLAAAALIGLATVATAQTPAPSLTSAPNPTPRGGPPTWPQRFEVRGPEQATFGFAVTQPGPVMVDVHWRGAPLRVSLLGPNTVEQTGAGRVVLRYTVTAQDVQRGLLWAVSIAQQTPAPTPVGGEISVRHPPTDQAAVQRAMQSQQMTKQQVEQATVQADAQLEQAIAVRKAEFTQQISMRERADMERFRMSIGRPATTPAPDQVSTRAIPPQNPGAPKFQYERPPRLIPVPAPPPYEITSLSATAGGPRSGLLITGMGFGTYPGLVYLTLPSHLQSACDAPCLQAAALRGTPFEHEGRRATITGWTDTSIVVELPELTGVTGYTAQVFVMRNGQVSNRMPFSFVPRQELRIVRDLPGDRRHSGTIITAPAWIQGPKVMHTRVPSFPFSEFAGEKGNDEYYLRTTLQNGWTMSAVKFYANGEGMQGLLSQEIKALLSGAGGAYVEQQGGGNTPYVNIRWWINPFKPFMLYHYWFEITGPAGVPDGIVVP